MRRRESAKVAELSVREILITVAAYFLGKKLCYSRIWRIREERTKSGGSRTVRLGN